MFDSAISIEAPSSELASLSWEGAVDEGCSTLTPAPQPVGSAESVAYIRALATRERDPSIRLSDPFSQVFLGSLWRLALALPPWLCRRYCERTHPGTYGLVLARTRHLDRLLLRCLGQGIQQLVILGAGYDTRPYRYAESLRRVRIFEVDLPGTQARKRTLLDGADVPGRERVRFVPLDLERSSLEASLVMAGYQLSRPTLFLAEGLLYYLTPLAVDRMLRCVARNACPGSSIAFDYAIQEFVDGDTSAHGAREAARWFVTAGEPCCSGFVPIHLARSLALRGFSLISELGPGEMERSYLTGEDGQRVQRCLGIFRLAHARVPG